MYRLVALPAWSGYGKVDNWADPQMSQAYFECACGSMMGTPVGVVTGPLEGWIGALVGHKTDATGCCIGIGVWVDRLVVEVRWSPKSSRMARHWFDGRIDPDLCHLGGNDTRQSTLHLPRDTLH